MSVEQIFYFKNDNNNKTDFFTAGNITCNTLCEGAQII